MRNFKEKKKIINVSLCVAWSIVGTYLLLNPHRRITKIDYAILLIVLLFCYLDNIIGGD